MKIILLGAPKNDETELLVSEIKKRGWEYKIINISELLFVCEKFPKVYYQGQNLADLTDAVIIRGMTKRTDETLILADYLNKKNVRVIDSRLATGRYLMTKLSMSFKLSVAGVGHPKTLYAVKNSNLNDIVLKIGLPIVAKKINGRYSKGVYRFKNENEINDFFQDEKIEGYIFQEDLESNDYYRVFTIGFKAIGAMKRTKLVPLSNKNEDPIARSKAVKMSDKLKNIAESAARVSENEICGIDIMKKDGNYYIIETNRAPQFKAFSKKTGINVAKKILDYVQETLHLPPKLD